MTSPQEVLAIGSLLPPKETSTARRQAILSLAQWAAGAWPQSQPDRLDQGGTTKPKQVKQGLPAWSVERTQKPQTGFLVFVFNEFF